MGGPGEMPRRLPTLNLKAEKAHIARVVQDNVREAKIQVVSPRSLQVVKV